MSRALSTHPEAIPVFALARDWLAVVDETREGTRDVLRFVAVWMAFSALYGLISKNPQERQQLEAFTNVNHVRSFHAELLSRDDTYLAAARTLCGGELFNHWRRASGHETLAPCDESNLSALTLRILVIRGNLFHGHKSPTVKRDIELVRNAFIVVERLVREFVEPDRLLPAPSQGKQAPARSPR
ncbi:MAG TPA: hypothetical protein VJ733_08615 [Candidatus Binatia bacterium]|nr:hypothetical protein [Candidatus Binatia bacterium]